MTAEPSHCCSNFGLVSADMAVSVNLDEPDPLHQSHDMTSPTPSGENIARRMEFMVNFSVAFRRKRMVAILLAFHFRCRGLE